MTPSSLFLAIAITMCVAVVGTAIYQRARGGIVRGWLTFHAFVLAGAATLLGWSQSLIYYRVSEVPLALWFPSVVLADAHGEAMILISLIQFPALAFEFAFAKRYWPVAAVVSVLTLVYAISAAIAYVQVFPGQLV
jgi:hypothetical protein